jgi:hypothetical protein
MVSYDGVGWEHVRRLATHVLEKYQQEINIGFDTSPLSAILMKMGHHAMQLLLADSGVLEEESAYDNRMTRHARPTLQRGIFNMIAPLAISTMSTYTGPPASTISHALHHLSRSWSTRSRNSFLQPLSHISPQPLRATTNTLGSLRDLARELYARFIS